MPGNYGFSGFVPGTGTNSGPGGGVQSVTGNIVNNTDPQNPVVTGIGFPISLTYAAAQALVIAGTVIAGQLYLITDANGTYNGALVTGMTDNKSFSLVGSGGYFNTDFQNIGDYSGVASLTFLAAGTRRGQWTAANEAGYSNGDMCIANGLHYQLFDSGAINGTNPQTNFSAYSQLLKHAGPNLGYIQVWDDIEFDFANNWTQRRQDNRTNDVSDPFAFQTGAINTFQWGNDNVVGNISNSVGTLRCLNNSGILQANQVITGGNIDASTNAGTLAENIVQCNGNLVANLSTGIVVDSCIVTTYFADLSAITANYTSKILSPSKSTFDADVELLTSGTMPVPSYVGIARIITASPGDNVCNNFSTQPTFPRRFTVSAGADANVKFDDSSTIIFPVPSTDTTIPADENSFIEFQYNLLTGKFVQTASEQFS